MVQTSSDVTHTIFPKKQPERQRTAADCTTLASYDVYECLHPQRGVPFWGFGKQLKPGVHGRVSRLVALEGRSAARRRVELGVEAARYRDQHFDVERSQLERKCLRVG